MVGDRDGIQKILVEEDLMKSPLYDLVKPDAKIADLLSERDRVEYKKRVCIIFSRFNRYGMLGNDERLISKISD